VETSEIHRIFDNARPPAAAVANGDVVEFECPGLPLPPGAGVAEFLASLDPQRPHTLVGPVAVDGAMPGDTLAVEVLSVDLIADFGYTGFVPGFGLLPDDFDEPYIHEFALDPALGYTELRQGVRIPLNPFCGIMGVALGAPGQHVTMPPRRTGGNVDIRHLVGGSTLYLPVEVPGALFSCGDGHAAQGDGEVCISAIETAVRATLRLTVDKGKRVAGPEFHITAPLSVDPGPAGTYATSAPGPDLHECSRNAIRAMIVYLAREHGLTREEAYVLCSLVVDLKINEIVDAPNWLVSAYLPLSVFA
jgi:acetamidase/formamidase